MDIYIARQPIFDRQLNTVAYELLYRNDVTNISNDQGDLATSNVLINGLLLMGIETLAEKKRLFVKFTRNFLVNEIATLFHPEILTIEVLEHYDDDEIVTKALKKLKLSGYTIALDDYRFNETFGDLLTLSDIIKVDFQAVDRTTIREIAESFSDTRIQLLAEKVETKEEFEYASKLGFDYFQGYFFEKPSVKISKDIRSFKSAHINILQELGNDQPDYKNIARIIETDMGLVYQLLKLVNSASFSGIKQITSIHQALVRLGIKEISKWMTLIMLREFGSSTIEELVRISVIRARVMESIAVRLKLEKQKNEFFIVGMFSLIDTILQRPMNDILDELDLNENITDALLGQDNSLSQTLEYIIAVEKGQWVKTETLFAENIDLTPNAIFAAFNEARKWLRSIYDMS